MHPFSRCNGRLLSVAVALSACVWLAQGRDSRAADVTDVRRGDDFVAELARSWPTVGLDDLASTEFDFVALKYVVLENSAISRKDLEVLVEDIKTTWKATGDVKDIIEVAKHLPLSQEFMAENWAMAHCVTRGQFWRSRLERGAPSKKKFSADFCYAFGKENVDHFPPCKEVNIYDMKSAYSRYGPKDMILVPPLEEQTAILASDRGSDLVTLKTPYPPSDDYEILEASRSTKLVNWVKSYSGNGALRGCDAQIGFAEYTGGDGSKRIFPAITVFAGLSPQQMVLELDILVKKNVQFNHPVPDKAFRVAVPKETWVHLYSGNGPYASEALGKDYLEDAA